MARKVKAIEAVGTAEAGYEESISLFSQAHTDKRAAAQLWELMGDRGTVESFVRKPTSLIKPNSQ